MRLAAHGFDITLPEGWEGAIVQQAAVPAQPSRRAATVTTRGAVAPPTIHLANFALPPVRGDFGSGAVERMTEQHAFISLLEYGPDSLGTAIFARQGMPRHLSARDFDPRGLQRTIAGQAGHQTFFTEAGRALCLYAVIGHTGNAAALATQVSRTLAAIRIGVV